MGKLTLSVILPNYNHGKYIERRLKEILNQSFKPFEVIVLDDGSTDDSVKIIEQFVKNNPSVRLIRNEKNMGIIVSANRLLEQVSGDYIYAASADDVILPDFFRKSMELLEKYPHAGFCHSRQMDVDEKGRQVGESSRYTLFEEHHGYMSPESVRAQLRANLEFGANGNTAIIRTGAMREAGGYIPELDAFADGFLYMIIALKHGVCYIPEIFAYWRRTEGISASLHADVRKSREVICHTAQLMDSLKYKNLFPRNFAKKWVKHRLYNYGKELLYQFRNEQKIFLKRIGHLQRRVTFIDRLSLRILALLNQIQFVTAKLYLIYRGFSWTLVSIKLRLIYFKMCAKQKQKK